MKKLIFAFIILISNSVIAKEYEINCTYKNANISKEIKNQVPKNLHLFLDLYLPFDFDINYKYSKNNWSIENINISIFNSYIQDLDNVYLKKQLDKREKLFVKLLGYEQDISSTDAINNLNRLTDEEFEVLKNQTLNQLKNQFNGIFIREQKLITNLKVTDFDQRYILFPNEDLVNNVILYSVLDSANIIRYKIPFPEIINNRNANVNMSIVNPDKSIFFEASGTCINSDFKQVENKIEVNQSDSIESKLKKLKSLFDQQLITQDEYDKKRKEILDAM